MLNLLIFKKHSTRLDELDDQSYNRFDPGMALYGTAQGRTSLKRQNQFDSMKPVPAKRSMSGSGSFSGFLQSEDGVTRQASGIHPPPLPHVQVLGQTSAALSTIPLQQTSTTMAAFPKQQTSTISKAFQMPQQLSAAIRTFPMQHQSPAMETYPLQQQMSTGMQVFPVQPNISAPMPLFPVQQPIVTMANLPMQQIQKNESKGGHLPPPQIVQKQSWPHSQQQAQQHQQQQAQQNPQQQAWQNPQQQARQNPCSRHRSSNIFHSYGTNKSGGKNNNSSGLKKS